jgi:hypothetical protein
MYHIPIGRTFGCRVRVRCVGREHFNGKCDPIHGKGECPKAMPLSGIGHFGRVTDRREIVSAAPGAAFLSGFGAAEGTLTHLSAPAASFAEAFHIG